MKNITEFFKDPDGNLSSTRLAMLWIMVLVTFYFIYSLIWLHKSPITYELTILLTTVFGLKAAQNYSEKK